jgi:hypothetical protein
MTVKDIAREVVEHAHDNCSLEELVDNIRLQHRLEIAHQESNQGKTLSGDQMKKRFQSWASQNIKSSS